MGDFLEKSPKKGEKMLEKEYLYIGHYTDINGNYMLKIGTTNNLKRRATEHTRNYRRAKKYQMPENGKFEYDWSLPLSKYNTLRYEDNNRKKFQNEGVGIFVNNDRFCCAEKPSQIVVKIRKEYHINL